MSGGASITTTAEDGTGARVSAAGGHQPPLRAKAAILGMLGCALGLGIGAGGVALGLPVWALLLAFAGATALVAWLAQAWVAAPLDRLVRQLELMARASRPQMLKELPVERGDEIGCIAQSVQRIAIQAVRNHHEARQLRQTLDSRVAVETDQAVRQLRQMALRDPLTDLGNRRFLDEHLESLVKVSLAAHTDLVCLLIDVDKFKEVNDALGHQAGDELLTLLAGMIRASVRHDDLAVRFGGDEFVILMPGAAMPRVESLAEGLRKLLRQQARVRFPTGPHADLSIGIASLLADRCESGERLLAMADARLYEAKRRGRGCTIGLGDQPVNVKVDGGLQLAV